MKIIALGGLTAALRFPIMGKRTLPKRPLTTVSLRHRRMANSPSELKRTSADRLENMRPDLGVHKRIRLRRAGCGESKSLLHDSVARHHSKLLQDDYKKRWGHLTRDLALTRLRLLTVLNSIVPLNQRAVIRSVERMERVLERVFKEAGARLLGAVEVEIVNLSLLRKIGSLSEDETRKLNVLESISASDAENGSKIPGAQEVGVLVQFHGIVDLGVRNSLLREDQLRKGTKKITAWQRSPYQVEIKRLFKDRSVEQNLQDIASYITKGGSDRLRYNAGFGRDLAEDLDAKIWRTGTGRTDEGGDTVADERGLTIGEIKFLDDIWNALMARKLNKRGYLVRK